MYKAIFSKTKAIMECSEFKTLYRAVLYELMFNLRRDDLETISIEVDGVPKYNVYPVRWRFGTDRWFSVHLVRHSDGKIFTVRNILSDDLGRGVV